MKSKSVSPAQMEILKLIWENNATGLSASDVWKHLSSRRNVARTTVLTQISRLESNGWLTRDESSSIARFRVTQNPGNASHGAVQSFIEKYFSGSPSNMMLALLGGDQLTQNDVAEIKTMLAQWEENQK